ncbi:glycoside hydrolase family 28 protein [Sphingomonas sp.]|jgi:polygalacturonase|uniref:glycoside hydrolase family 28 protein n=1 Tax=Sphingomonas sp. TaxID=28214 RepID=UPI002ED95A7C
MIQRRAWLKGLASIAAAAFARRAGAAARSVRVIDVRTHGARGDGKTLDTAAIQRAIDAARPGDSVHVPAGRRFVCGPLRLKGGIDFRVDGTLLVSTRAEDYPEPMRGVLHAEGADGLTISGRGAIDGRSPDFMERYDAEGEWYVPKPFRPRLVVLENCADLVIRDLTLRQAPSWTVHLVGCRRVLVERLTIANQLDVPNCDGIDPDHCQDVVIRHCRITCGDDAIVLKATRGREKYGPTRNIHVHDCVLETQDSGLKIGTETVQDIHDVLFERCTVIQGCRGLCIQLRDEGSVYNVVFRDIRFTARYFSAPWWGRGEGISFTAIPRTPTTRLGTIHHVTVERVTGRAENSVRIEGSVAARVHDITLSRVAMTLDRWTRYPGAVFDNRPTTVLPPLEPHTTPGFSIRHADRVTLDRCRLRWGTKVPDSFTHAVEAEHVTALSLEGFAGEAAHPARDAAISQR